MYMYMYMYMHYKNTNTVHVHDVIKVMYMYMWNSTFLRFRFQSVRPVNSDGPPIIPHNEVTQVWRTGTCTHKYENIFFLRLVSLGGGPQAHVHMKGMKCRVLYLNVLGMNASASTCEYTAHVQVYVHTITHHTEILLLPPPLPPPPHLPPFSYCLLHPIEVQEYSTATSSMYGHTLINRINVT